MSWNYRVIRHPEPDGEDYLQIHEVHYDILGNPASVATDGARIGSETVNGLAQVLDMMKEATKKPILDFAPFAHKKRNGSHPLTSSSP